MKAIFSALMCLAACVLLVGTAYAAENDEGYEVTVTDAHPSNVRGYLHSRSLLSGGWRCQSAGYNSYPLCGGAKKGPLNPNPCIPFTCADQKRFGKCDTAPFMVKFDTKRKIRRQYCTKQCGCPKRGPLFTRSVTDFACCKRRAPPPRPPPPTPAPLIPSPPPPPPPPSREDCLLDGVGAGITAAENACARTVFQCESFGFRTSRSAADAPGLNTQFLCDQQQVTACLRTSQRLASGRFVPGGISENFQSLNEDCIEILAFGSESCSQSQAESIWKRAAGAICVIA